MWPSKYLRPSTVKLCSSPLLSFKKLETFTGFGRSHYGPRIFPWIPKIKKINKQDGTPIADAESPGVAAEIARAP